MEPSKEAGLSPKGKTIRSLRGVAKSLWESLNPNVRKVLIEEIDEGTVAGVIYSHLGNPARERLGLDRWANPFSIVDVLANMGYVGVWTDTDYFKKFPREYQKTRQSLQKLVDQNLLETQALEEPDSNGERIHYKVVDEGSLRVFGQKTGSVAK